MTTVAAKETERLHVAVTLIVTHRVRVTLDAKSDQTIDELKTAALEEFHRDPGSPRYGGGTGLRTEDKWRAQFMNRSNIDVGSEVVAIAGVDTVPRRPL